MTLNLVQTIQTQYVCLDEIGYVHVGSNQIYMREGEHSEDVDYNDKEHHKKQ